jgi:foldase protein PrsA
MSERRRGMRARVLLMVMGVGLLGGELAWAQDGNAVAFVNGVPLRRDKLVDVLLEAHGLSVMQQLVMLELAQQHTRRLGLTVTPADVQAEFTQSLARIAPEADPRSPGLGEAEREQALDVLLAQKGISRVEFMIGMERNAHLRKIVERDFRVDDATLREEFARTYGERVQVRHILVRLEDSRRINEVQSLLKQGTDFAEVARRLSQHPESGPRGGELAPFSFTDGDIPAALREAAFALSPGEVSNPIRIDRDFHIIKLERRLPPENVRFEDVRETVAVRLRERVVPAKMGELATDLFRQAKVQVVDRKLREQYEALLQRSAAEAGTP